MADNTILNTGAGGDTLATDDIGGVKFPRSKLVIGADGVNDGDVSAANPLPITSASLTSIDTKTPALGQALAAASVPVVLTAAQLTTLTPLASIAVTNAGTFVVQENGAALTALQLLDDTVATDAAASPAKGQMLAGHDGTNARRVAVDASGNLQIDVLSSALPAGAATEAKQDTLIGHVDGVEAALVDAVTALQIIDDWDEVNRAKINLIVGQAGVAAGAGAVDATTQRVTHASDDPGVALLTTIDVDTGNAATSLAVIDDWDESDRCKVTLPATDRPTSHYRNVDANAEAEIKGSAGTLYWIHAINLTAAVAYLHLYDDTAANVTPGTTTPTYTFPIPTAGSTNGAGFTFNFGGRGQAFANGITLVVTTTIDGAAGDPGTNGVMINGGFS